MTKVLLAAFSLLAASAVGQPCAGLGPNCATTITPAFGGTIESVTITVTQAQVQAFGTTEVEIVPADTGVTFIPRLTVVAKAAGAYTVGGVTSLLLGWGTVADALPACAWANSPAFSLMVATGAQTVLGCQILSNGVSGGIPFGVIPNVVSISGKKLAIRSTGASPAGSGGDLTFRLWYERVPSSLLVP